MMLLGGELMIEVIYLLISIVSIMVILKLLFAEMDGRSAGKNSNIKYFLFLAQDFKYTRTFNIIFLLFISFLFFTNQNIFTLEGAFSLSLFITIGVISDIISQLFYYQYAKKRFKIEIEKAINMREDLIKESQKQVDYSTLKVYKESDLFNEIVEGQMNQDEHVSFVTLDGGVFVNSFNKLPNVCYNVDLYDSKAKIELINRAVKVLAFKNSINQLLPFKDEKIDTLVIKDLNLNYKEAFRVLKEDGCFVLSQLGNEHLHEIVMPVAKLKSKPNISQCIQLLKESGFIVLSQYEDKEEIRFESIGVIMQYFKKSFNDNVEAFINPLTVIYQQIKSKGYFSITVHKFYIVAKKRSALLE
jgi:hypothetical protein